MSFARIASAAQFDLCLSGMLGGFVGWDSTGELLGSWLVIPPSLNRQALHMLTL